MRKIDTIIFDLGRVLINVETERGIFGLLSANSGQHRSDMLQNIISDPMVRLHNTGKISSHDFYQHLNSSLNLNIVYDEFQARWCDIFSPITDMTHLLLQLSGKYKLGLLSDTDPIHWDYARNTFSFLSVFNNPTLSFEVGFCKPAPEIYLAACSMNCTSPEKALFIDDLQKNIDGATSVGLPAIRHISPQNTILQLKKLGIA